MSDIFVFQILLLLGFYLRFGACLHCWECNSKYDPNCGEPFKNATIALADCSQRFLNDDMDITSTICRKITQKVNGQERIIRSCGFYNPEDAGHCIYRAGTHMVYMHYCQCAGEGCNSSGDLVPRIPTILATLLLLLVATALS
ncbi:hypothetical protein JTE90_012788 [Oedothorax gibbosus]|uniref:Protein sleepless n=1 Tax=Oedothorax gibbosus TaxID=931172 RepID=A0AAV6VYM7_9ARAC|nr:hypothetical protein JTE90_012788 [Oedothorax gibbosus]